MAQSSRARPLINKLTNGIGNPAGVAESKRLMTVVESLGQSFTTNKEGVAAYKLVVERGLNAINGLVDQIAGLINSLTDYIEQLKAKQSNTENNKELNATIQDLKAQKQELIAVIKYADETIRQNNLTGVNELLTTSTAEADALMARITDNLNAAINRARTALGQQAPAPIPSSSAASGAAGGGGGGANPTYATRQANVTDINNTDLRQYVNKVIGNIVTTKDQVRRTQLLTEATDIINNSSTLSKSDKDLAIQLITEKYNNLQKGGKRPHRSHRHRRTKKSRTRKKSKKSRKINYKGGYRAKFPKGQGRGSHKRRSKHTSHRQ